MNRTRTSLTALAAMAVAAGTFGLATAPAHADGPERSQEFRFAGAEVDFGVEKHKKKFEVEVDLDDAQPRSRWRLVLRHDGKVVHDRTYTADREGELGFTKHLRNTAGKDKFKLTVRKVGGPKRYSTIVMR